MQGCWEAAIVIVGGVEYRTTGRFSGGEDISPVGWMGSFIDKFGEIKWLDESPLMRASGRSELGRI